MSRYDLPWPGVWLEVEPCRPDATYGWPLEVHDPAREARPEVQLVHVVSDHAGGEIRGYWLAHGALWLRMPCYSGPWAEMDVAVAAALGVEVRRYSILPGGAVEYPSPAHQPAPGVPPAQGRLFGGPR